MNLARLIALKIFKLEQYKDDKKLLKKAVKKLLSNKNFIYAGELVVSNLIFN